MPSVYQNDSAAISFPFRFNAMKRGGFSAILCDHVQLRLIPYPQALHRIRFGVADAVVILGTLALLYVAARTGSESLVKFRPPDIIPAVSLDPHNLPNYAARSTLRMFVALFASTIFTLVYGYIAAHSRRAEKVLVPLLDVLQSVPVLGFLSITVTGFIALFPGSLLGIEAASIFAIFTGQAWNMTFSFYQSLRTLPLELEEMSTLYGLSRWERFTRLEVPAALIGLVWNGMMSFGGGWFFLAASEAISVLNINYTLPGLGSYVAAAVVAKDFQALGWAILTMVTLIVLIDIFFWRLLVAWADRFKLELSAGNVHRYWLLELFRASRVPRFLGAIFDPITKTLDAVLARLSPMPRPKPEQDSTKKGDHLYDVILICAVMALVAAALRFILKEVGIAEFGTAALLGLATMARVLLLLVFSTLVWTPIGVAIGFHPRLAQLAQPVVQVLASFPANFIFPFAISAFVALGIHINWGCILLMALGSQWYVLFNVIAGAQSIPNDLREMADSIGLRGWKKWRALIAPGIFGAWVTGAITASGGAWNASIVSEFVTWGSTTLTAYGLGAYIQHATSKGDWPRIVLGVGMMSLFVVGANRFLWRRLYAIAEAKYRLA
jgi:NitT/TauT family transport system permease protein